MLAHTLQLWRICQWPSGHGRLFHGVSVALAEGSHPVPFRTRKLSPPAPMVLPGKLGGRVGRRRSIFATPPRTSGAAFAFPTCLVLARGGSARMPPPGGARVFQAILSRSHPGAVRSRPGG